MRYFSLQSLFQAMNSSSTQLGQCVIYGSFVVLASCTGFNQTYLVDSEFLLAQFASTQNPMSPTIFKAFNFTIANLNSKWVQNTDEVNFNYL